MNLFSLKDSSEIKLSNCTKKYLVENLSKMNLLGVKPPLKASWKNTNYELTDVFTTTKIGYREKQFSIGNHIYRHLEFSWLYKWVGNTILRLWKSDLSKPKFDLKIFRLNLWPNRKSNKSREYYCRPFSVQISIPISM